MKTKRSFLTLLSSLFLFRPHATAQSEEAKAIRTFEVDLKTKHLSLKEYYLQLIESDKEIRRQFQKIERQTVDIGDAHYQGPDAPTVIPWFPSSEEWGHTPNNDMERFLVIHPLRSFRSHYAWTDNSIISEFECITTHVDDDDRKAKSAKAVYRFLGFRKVTVEPLTL